MNICNDDFPEIYCEEHILSCKTSPLRIVWRFYLRSIFVSFESHSVNPVKTIYIFFPHGCPTAGRNLRLICLVRFRFHLLGDTKRRMWFNSKYDCIVHWTMITYTISIYRYTCVRSVHLHYTEIFTLIMIYIYIEKKDTCTYIYMYRYAFENTCIYILK